MRKSTLEFIGTLILTIVALTLTTGSLYVLKSQEHAYWLANFAFNHEGS